MPILSVLFSVLAKHFRRLSSRLSFADWPPFTRFISPSFYSNPFGCLDLNQITPTDAGVQATQVLQHEHPTGQDYATYLRTISRTTSYGGSPLRSRVVFGSYVSEVERLEWAGRMAFRVATSDGAQRYARYVIYAGGEFGHPYEPPNLTTEEGATVHYSKVRDWASYVEAGRAVVVGGGEAGFDAALYLIAEIEAGEVVVVARGGGEGEKDQIPQLGTPLLAAHPHHPPRLVWSPSQGRPAGSTTPAPLLRLLRRLGCRRLFRNSEMGRGRRSSPS